IPLPAPRLVLASVDLTRSYLVGSINVIPFSRQPRSVNVSIRRQTVFDGNGMFGTKMFNAFTASFTRLGCALATCPGLGPFIRRSTPVRLQAAVEQLQILLLILQRDARAGLFITGVSVIGVKHFKTSAPSQPVTILKRVVVRMGSTRHQLLLMWITLVSL